MEWCPARTRAASSSDSTCSAPPTASGPTGAKGKATLSTVSDTTGPPRAPGCPRELPRATASGGGRLGAAGGQEGHAGAVAVDGADVVVLRAGADADRATAASQVLVDERSHVLIGAVRLPPQAVQIEEDRGGHAER